MDLDRVLDPFFTTKGPDKGTGLGLSICKSIVEEFGGSLEIASIPGEGTEVRILIPPRTAYQDALKPEAHSTTMS